MTFIGWVQIALMFGAVALIAKPLGLYMADVFNGERTWLSPVLEPMERGFCTLSGIDRTKEQSWLGYTLAMLAFSAAGFVSLYLMLRVQGLLPLNPRGFPGLAPDLAFNTSVSFLTNTNWQSYAGETTMSNLSQMWGLTVHNFLSAATGIAVAVAFTRAFVRSNADRIGNFWVDVTRATLYVLLPLAVVLAIAFVALGLPQTLDGSLMATTLEGAQQTVALGPVASQEAIKQLGTNGGGFFNANAAHPFENPNGVSNFLNIFTAISATLPAALGSLANGGPHGLTEILYAFSSAAGNNGSAFGGLSANTPWFNTTLGIAMLLGRFAYVVPVMAIAGSLAAKTRVPASQGTFPTDGPLFVGLLVGVILITGGLQFFPALALGPIIEHFLMIAGQTF